jgi:hypothetical protein
LFEKHICIDIYEKLIVISIFGAGVLGPPVWEPDPFFQGCYADAPKTSQPAPMPATNLGAPMEMLLALQSGRHPCRVCHPQWLRLASRSPQDLRMRGIDAAEAGGSSGEKNKLFQ